MYLHGLFIIYFYEINIPQYLNSLAIVFFYFIIQECSTRGLQEVLH